MDRMNLSCGTAVHFHFDGQRDQALDFFRRVARPLRDDFHHRRRKVGVGIHRHAMEGK
jgi:hypothetical protein